jgi:hypothetical protein
MRCQYISNKGDVKEKIKIHQHVEFHKPLENTNQAIDL